MPSSHFAPGGHVVTSPRGSGLGPIPRPARENPSPGSHGAVRGCGHSRIRREAGQTLHPSSQTGVEAAQLLCPRQSGHHTPQQWAHARARASPGKAEGTWHWWKAQCQADFTLSTPAVQHICLFLPAQGLPYLQKYKRGVQLSASSRNTPNEHCRLEALSAATLAALSRALGMMHSALYSMSLLVQSHCHSNTTEDKQE